MINFREHYKLISEKLITFGGLRPAFGNVVIMAGGAGSGKGFVLDKLIGIEGKVFDVDALKEMALKSELLSSRMKEQFGLDATKLNLKNPDDVFKLHEVVDVIKLSDRKQDIIFKTIMTSAPDRKPNLIFDVTMKSLSKLAKITAQVQRLGYEKANIHIVWVVNEMETAIQQNRERDRQVPVSILKDTHKHVSYTVKELLTGGELIRKYMDGDFWLVFNKKYTDSLFAVSDNGGSYIKDAVYTKVKPQGKPLMPLSDISDDVINKIKQYVPNPEVWSQ
jgi:hypothetical protein